LSSTITAVTDANGLVSVNLVGRSVGKVNLTASASLDQENIVGNIEISVL
jgi:hypothetical protein